MSKELTDKWQKGELENGLYYFGNKDKSEIAYLDKRSIYTMDNNIPKCLKENTEVLAPVPSYDELESMNTAVSECMQANQKLLEENERLKKQLELAIEALEWYALPDHFAKETLKKIKELDK